jgi:S1-C subfamily serine protease
MVNEYFLTNCHVVDVDHAFTFMSPQGVHTPHQISVNEYSEPDPDFESANADVIEAHPDIDVCVVTTRALSDDLKLGPLNVQMVRSIRPFTDLNIGETVFAIGNPTLSNKLSNETLRWTVTRGIISGLRPHYKNGEVLANVIQTDAAITQGNSGGALFDEYGNLIGIPQSTYNKTQGFSFAIAADEIWVRYGITRDAQQLPGLPPEHYELPDGIVLPPIPRD